jgi:ABC-type sugar transport system ATPase subunit
MTSITLDRVVFGYRRETLIFDDLSLRLSHDDDKVGRVVAVMGRSGSGKTTLLRLVAGVETPSRGVVDVAPVGANVSYLQQEPVLFEHLSRLENARYFSLVRNRVGQFEESTFARLADKLRLGAILDHPGRVDEMSGGERQRLALLRALSIRPRILLLDEPCTGLDVDVKLEFLHMLREVVDDFGLLTLYVTHHAEEAQIVADDFLYLSSARAGHPGNAVALTSISDAFLHPPTVEAAQSFLTPLGNVMRCTVDESGVVTSTGQAIGTVDARQIRAGRYTFVFPAESVVWTTESTRVVETLGQSSQYWFVRLGEEKLVGPKTESRPASFVLTGSVVAFHESASSGIRTVMRN